MTAIPIKNNTPSHKPSIIEKPKDTKPSLAPDAYFLAQAVHITTLSSFALTAGLVYYFDCPKPAVFISSIFSYLTTHSVVMSWIQNHYSLPAAHNSFEN